MMVIYNMFRTQSALDAYTLENNTPPSQWSSSVWNILDSETSSPSDVLTTLSIFAPLKDCYAKKAGVIEGYTVGEHTIRVIELAQKYRACLEQDVSDLVTWSEFLLFLALHDIGKGIANDNRSSLSTQQFKEEELRTTRHILKKTMEHLGVPTQKNEIFCELLQFDTLGDYLQFKTTIEQASDNIFEMADNCHASPKTFYRLFKTFHIVDAASYPNLEPLFTRDESSISYTEGLKQVSALLEERLSIPQATNNKVAPKALSSQHSYTNLYLIAGLATTGLITVGLLFKNMK